MADEVVPRVPDAPSNQNSEPSRKTLRLTFQNVDGEVRLVRQERLDMITPPTIGERPEAGKNSGFWIELHDQNGTVLSHRIIHAPLRDAVEVHSPDGSIERVTGSPSNATFEVLLPDQGQSSTAVLMGRDTRASANTTLTAGVAATGSQELARFDLSK